MTHVSIMNGVLSANFPKTGDCRFDLSLLQHVSIMTNLYAGMPLHVMELRKRTSPPLRIPTLAEGFEHLLLYLRTMPEFNDAEYRKAITGTIRARHVLLQKPLPINATLHAFRSPEVLRQELRRGFTIHEALEERWPSLDDTVEEFARHTNVSFDRNDFGQGILHAGPVRFGDLELDEWQTYCPDGPSNRPLKVLHRDVVLGAGDLSYWKLKEYFYHFLGEGEGWERSDSNHWQFQHDGILVTLMYWYNSDNAVESGFCKLLLTNQRTYPQYLTDAYSDCVNLAETVSIVLPCVMDGPATDFRQTSWVKETPPTILALLHSRQEFIVWNDKKNSRIGFALGRSALIIPYAECREIRLLHARPARGDGYSELRILESGETGREFLAGRSAFGELKKYREALERTLGLPLASVDNLYDD